MGLWFSANAAKSQCFDDFRKAMLQSCWNDARIMLLLYHGPPVTLFSLGFISGVVGMVQSTPIMTPGYPLEDASAIMACLPERQVVGSQTSMNSSICWLV